jgi:hypothetical protein
LSTFAWRITNLTITLDACFCFSYSNSLTSIVGLFYVYTSTITLDPCFVCLYVSYTYCPLYHLLLLLPSCDLLTLDAFFFFSYVCDSPASCSLPLTLFFFTVTMLLLFGLQVAKSHGAVGGYRRAREVFVFPAMIHANCADISERNGQHQMYLNWYGCMYMRMRVHYTPP